ncbi:MAG: hypothetical protein AAFU79_12860 [Myxococcota bacterium]
MSVEELSGGGGALAEERLRPRVIEVCDAVGAFIETWGFRSIHGRVWALLALSSRPLSQTEVAERLGVSRSLVNLAIGELSGFALVRATGPQRNAPYEARMDVWPTITGVLRKREWMLMESARVALEALSQEVGYEVRSGRAPGYDPRRVEVLLLMTELAQACLRGIFAVRMPESFEAYMPWLRKAREVVTGLERNLPRILRSRPS